MGHKYEQGYIKNKKRRYEIMENLPKIEVCFFFEGDDFDVNDVTDQMQLTPTQIREKKDFPIEELAHTEWLLTTEKESCKVVFRQFEKLMKLLVGKEKVINQICSNHKISVGFCVTIWMEDGDKPEIVLTKEIVLFLASINAEVGFDLYIY